MKYRNNILTLRKISIDNLIEVLTALQGEGADYIDITGISDDVKDIISMNVKEEYIRSDGIKGLTDEHLNQLI